MTKQGTPIEVLSPWWRVGVLIAMIVGFSVLIRISGDLLSNQLVRQWGGLLNEVAILLFLAVTVYSLLKTRK